MDSIQNTDKQTDAQIAFKVAELQRERLSALADGQLHGDDLTETLALFDDAQAGAQARAAWHALHVVGDVLRTHEAMNCRKDADFLARFSSALQLEPNWAVVAQQAPAVVPITSVDATALEPQPAAAVNESANDAVFSWKWVAGLSSVAAAVAISWNLVGGTVAGSGAQLAQAGAPAGQLAFQAVPAASGNEVMLRSPQLDAMIAAHSQLGGSSALQMPSGFLRSATFDATLNSTFNPGASGSAR